MIQVRFLTGVPPYNAGEGAGFRPEFAHHLVAIGACEYMDPKVDGPKRIPSPEFKPSNDLEQRMLVEIDRLRHTRELSGEERDICDVTIGDARWSRNLREVRRR